MKAVVQLSSAMIGKAKAGDQGAFEALYHEYKHTVYRLCFRGTKNVADAEDLTQEVFLQVHLKVKDLRGEAAFKSWLYKITLNVTLMHLRKRRTEGIPLQHFEGETTRIPDALQTHTAPRFGPLVRIALARAISGLPKQRRNVVLLHDIKGMSHREIATSLGVSLNTTKSNLCRAHGQLQRILLSDIPIVDGRRISQSRTRRLRKARFISVGHVQETAAAACCSVALDVESDRMAECVPDARKRYPQSTEARA